MHTHHHFDVQPLMSFSFPLPEEAFTGVAELTHGKESVWVQQGRGLVGYGNITTLSAPSAQRFTALRTQWTELVRTLRKELSGGFAAEDQAVLPSGVGLVGFSAITFAEHSGSNSLIVVPEIVVAQRLADHQANDFSRPDSIQTSHAVNTWLNWVLPQQHAAELLDLAELPAELTRAQHEHLTRAAVQRWQDLREDPHKGSRNTAAPEAVLEPGYVSDQQYLNSVRTGLQLLRARKAEKLVLSRDALVASKEPFDVPAVLKSLAGTYQQCWTYSVAADDDAPRLMGATPEMLIKVQQGHVSARLLAGTLDRDGATEEEHYPVTMLLENAKQRVEHQFAIDSLTQQLAGMVSTLDAPAQPFLLELPNVWHLASDVSAELTEQARASGCAIMDLVERVHPTAAVCGTPTQEAAYLLHKLEGYDRSWYAGPVGWLDDSGNGEFGLALRGGILETPQQLRLYAGCGVVVGSDPQVELAETWAKLRPMMQALDITR